MTRSVFWRLFVGFVFVFAILQLPLSIFGMIHLYGLFTHGPDYYHVLYQIAQETQTDWRYGR